LIVGWAHGVEDLLMKTEAPLAVIPAKAGIQRGGGEVPLV
jgi:hypothetical protein